MKNKFIIALYTLLICLFPLSFKFMFLSYSKIIYVVSLLILIYNIIYNKDNFKIIINDKRFKVLSIGFFLFAILLSISTIVNSILDNNFFLSNFFEVLRVFEYYMVIVNYWCLFVKKDNIRFFNMVLIFILIILSIIGIFQYFNLFNTNNLYIKFIAPTQYTTLLNNYSNPRIVGLAGNPNVFGFFIAVSIVYFLYLLLNKKFNWFLLILILLLNIILFMTLSRTAYICMVAGELLLVFIAKFNFKTIKKTFILIALIVLFNLLLLVALPRKLTWRVLELVNISDVTSWQERVNGNKEFWEYYSDHITSGDKHNNVDNPDSTIQQPSKFPINNNAIINSMWLNLMGNGPDKQFLKHSSIFDNEWLMILFRYGYIGVAAYIFMLIAPLIYFKQYEKNSLALYITIISMIFLYMVPAAAYHCDLLFLFCGVIIASCLVNKNGGDNIEKI